MRYRAIQEKTVAIQSADVPGAECLTRRATTPGGIDRRAAGPGRTGHRLLLIRVIHRASRETYGSPSIGMRRTAGA